MRTTASFHIIVAVMAGLCIGKGVIFPALGQAHAASRAMEAMARQSDEAATISRNLFIGLAMIESQALYVLIVALILLFANPPLNAVVARWQAAMLDVPFSTILFQALNFFILLALLHRFLYRPPLRVMQQREEAVAAQLRLAAERIQQAEHEREHPATERARAQTEAEELLARTRAAASATSRRLVASAEDEATKQLAAAGHRIQEQERVALEQLEHQVTNTAVALAGSLIRGAAGPAVHQVPVTDLFEQGLHLPPEQASRLEAALRANSGHFIVELAYPPHRRHGKASSCGWWRHTWRTAPQASSPIAVSTKHSSLAYAWWPA